MIPPGPRESITPERVLAAVERDPEPSAPRTASEVAEAVGCARRTAHTKLARLVERGDLRTKKVGARCRVYWLPAPTGTAANAPGSVSTRADRVDDAAEAVAFAVAGTRSAATLEAAACDRLVDRGPYRCAASGPVPSADGPFVPRTWAADDRVGDGDADPPPVDAAVVRRAARTGTVRVADVRDPPDAGRYAAIPLVAESDADGADDADDAPGVAVVFAVGAVAFDDDERARLAGLGRLLGTALRTAAATDRLLRERAVDCTFRSRALARAFARADDRPDASVDASADEVVALGDGGHVQYWSVAGGPPGPYVRALARHDEVEEVTLLRTVEGVSRLEVHTGPGSLAAAFDAFDGRPETARLREDVLEVVGRFPLGVDGEAVADAARRSVPDLEYVSRRPVATPTLMRAAVRDRLTGRQWATVRLAYAAGYFERPRRTTGADLAARVGVSATTFHRHLRAAEARLFAELLDDPTDRPRV
jgi:DNA-binding MarR family transcriptional regulator